jgi:hypothetical protein
MTKLHWRRIWLGGLSALGLATGMLSPALGQQADQTGNKGIPVSQSEKYEQIAKQIASRIRDVNADVKMAVIVQLFRIPDLKGNPFRPGLQSMISWAKRETQLPVESMPYEVRLCSQSIALGFKHSYVQIGIKGGDAVIFDGRATDRVDGNVKLLGNDTDRLKVGVHATIPVLGTTGCDLEGSLLLASGPLQDIFPRYTQALVAAEKINAQDIGYRLFGIGSPSPNSNAAAYTIVRAMGLESAATSWNEEHAVPGWGRDLLSGISIPSTPASQEALYKIDQQYRALRHQSVPFIKIDAYEDGYPGDDIADKLFKALLAIGEQQPKAANLPSKGKWRGGLPLNQL